jgi:very-short-patch-repair endonuclease
MSDEYSKYPLLRKQSKKREKSKGEEVMAQHLTAYKIPFEREVMFYSQRRWRFDFVLPDHKIAIEVEGGVFSGGAHTRGKHFEEDAIKYNTASILGWKVLRFSTGQVTRGEAINFIKRIKSLGIKEP